MKRATFQPPTAQASVSRSRVRSLSLVPLVALLAGCAADVEEGPVVSKDQELIGGHQAAPYHFRSTVGIGDVCTGAKVGPRLFLTAAHCVDVSRPGRGQPVPDPFPPNDGVADAYLPGEPLLINWGLNADDADQAQFTIVETTIHPSWWACPLCQDPNRSPDSAADIAVIEIAEDTPQIPEATVDLDPVPVGSQVTKVGWGCQERTNIDPNTVELGPYKTEDAWVLPTSALDHEMTGPPLTSGQIADIGQAYVLTAGHAQDEDYASLCLGDSGGPLYLPNNNERRIVGVNSDYTFRPGVPDQDGGISWTDWHTKTSVESQFAVAAWLVGLGVNTVGGDVPSSECTCPSGCDDVQQASVPLMQQGVDDTCYFFEDLGYSLNNHSMLQVNLNGQNITNQWVGYWSYPAEKDGGYYVYVKGDKSWSWWQATN